jgi:hypothetical protein
MRAGLNYAASANDHPPLPQVVQLFLSAPPLIRSRHAHLRLLIVPCRLQFPTVSPTASRGES